MIVGDDGNGTATENVPYQPAEKKSNKKKCDGLSQFHAMSIDMT